MYFISLWFALRFFSIFSTSGFSKSCLEFRLDWLQLFQVRADCYVSHFYRLHLHRSRLIYRMTSGDGYFPPKHPVGMKRMKLIFVRANDPYPEYSETETPKVGRWYPVTIGRWRSWPLTLNFPVITPVCRSGDGSRLRLSWGPRLICFVKGAGEFERLMDCFSSRRCSHRLISVFNGFRISSEVSHLDFVGSFSEFKVGQTSCRLCSWYHWRFWVLNQLLSWAPPPGLAVPFSDVADLRSTNELLRRILSLATPSDRFSDARAAVWWRWPPSHVELVSLLWNCSSIVFVIRCYHYHREDIMLMYQRSHPWTFAARIRIP